MSSVSVRAPFIVWRFSITSKLVGLFSFTTVSVPLLCELNASIVCGLNTAPSDGPADLVVTVEMPMLLQDCMPIIPPDPLRLSALLRVDNRGPAPAGPVTAMAGRLLTLGGQPIATFSVKAIQLGPVAAGQSATAPVDKNADSLNPAMMCGTVACGMDVIVALTYSIAGGPPREARSSSTAVMCVF